MNLYKLYIKDEFQYLFPQYTYSGSLLYVDLADVKPVSLPPPLFNETSVDL